MVKKPPFAPSSAKEPAHTHTRTMTCVLVRSSISATKIMKKTFMTLFHCG